jgi:release factor glutamine methyltransferase
MPQTLVIKDWLDSASHQLATINIPSYNLDADIILENAINKDRSYLRAYPEQKISLNQLKIANNNLKLRLNRVPIAYIIGYKEFYRRQFIVTPDTLIPRPESESIIDTLRIILEEIPKNQQLKLIDVGTGSGCLGITSKLEFPNLDIILSDISSKALKIAFKNSKILSAKVTIIQNDLLKNLTVKPNIIIANLPYVDQNWKRSPETNFEPKVALFANDNGLAIIKKLIIQASQSIATNGFLLIEADPTQHNQLIEFAEKYSFDIFYKNGYTITFKQHQ